jgi:putative transposase
MPQYRRARTEGATYFFTVVTHPHRPVLCLPESLDAMKEVSSSVARGTPCELMPRRFCPITWMAY